MAAGNANPQNLFMGGKLKMKYGQCSHLLFMRVVICIIYVRAYIYYIYVRAQIYYIYVRAYVFYVYVRAYINAFSACIVSYLCAYISMFVLCTSDARVYVFFFF